MFLIGFFVYLKNKKSLSSSILFLITIFFSLWVVSDIIIWISPDSRIVMFLWSLINLFEISVSLLMFYFSYLFLQNKDVSFKLKLFVIFLIFPLIILSFTNLNLSGFDTITCEAVQGPLLYYFYIFESLVFLSLLFYLVKKIIKSNTKDRKLVIIFSAGVLFFIFSFSGTNIIASLTQNWNILMYGLISAPVFAGILVYTIVKYKVFKIKLMATQALVWGLIILIGSQFFFIKIPVNFILNGVTFLGIIIFGINLIRSVKKEVLQRERLEQLRLKLEDTNIKLEGANEKLKDLDKLKTEFLSLASHQLRSPLTAIKGYSSMLLDGDYGEINPKAKETVDRIFLSSNNLAMVVEDLLNVSKIESGGMKYEMIDFDLGEVVAETSKEFSIIAEKKGLKLICDVDMSQKYMVNGDKEKLRQIVINLIDNSIKYTKEGSLNVSVIKKENKIVFFVKDTGMGIPPKIKDTLFEKYARGEGSKINPSGSGLGLYLAKQIVEAHKGRIWAESEGEGKGSTFLMELAEVKA
jgi:signal transduction histidine kinase